MSEIFLSFIQIGAMCISISFIAKITSSKNFNDLKTKNAYSSKKIKGYISSDLDGYKKIVFVLSLIFFLLTIYFLTIYFLKINDYIAVQESEKNNSLKIAGLMFIIFLFNYYIFIYTSKSKIYFNDQEIIKYRLIGKKQVLKFSDIEKVVATPTSKLILYSKNNRLVFELEKSNSNKFIALLAKKGIDINYKM